MDLPAPHFIPAKKGGDVRSRLHARTLHICNIRGLPVQGSAGLHFQPGRENFPRGVENEAIRVALAESDDIGPLFVGLMLVRSANLPLCMIPTTFQADR